MNYLVPGPVFDRMFNFLFDNPSPTSGRLLADLQREAKLLGEAQTAAKPAAPFDTAEPLVHHLDPIPPEPEPIHPSKEVGKPWSKVPDTGIV